jgi:hypothetical protein
MKSRFGSKDFHGCCFFAKLFTMLRTVSVFLDNSLPWAEHLDDLGETYPDETAKLERATIAKSEPLKPILRMGRL